MHHITGRRRVLLLAYHYPPRQGVGARRPMYLQKYLPRFGWDVTILTARIDGADLREPNVVATKYIDVLGSLKKRIGLNGTSTHHHMRVDLPAAGEKSTSLRHRAISLAYQVCTFPEREVGWTPFVFEALRRMVRTERFDAVIATLPPHVAGIAAALADCGVPWVADLRDIWTATDTIAREPAIRWLEGVLERWMLTRASALVATNKRGAAYLAQRFNRIPARSIYNSFDPEEWQDIPFARNDRCTLLFAGSLYHMRAQPVLLFRAVRSLVNRGALAEADLTIDIYSDEKADVARTADTEGVRDMVRAFDFVSHEAIRPLERRADRLLLLAWDGVGADLIAGAKVFEYLGARRPVLAVGGGAQSAIDDVLEEAQAGTRCTTIEEIASEVLRAVREFKEGSSRTLPTDSVAYFDAPHMAEQFADLLDRVVETQRSVVH